MTRKLLSLALALALVLTVFAPALADKGSEPVWTEYDNLIKEIKTATDFVAREALMHKAETMLMETGAIVPIYYYNDVFMAKEAVKGYYHNVFGTKFFQYVTNGDKTTLKLNLASEPDKLDPALNSTVDGATLAANSFGGLITYNAEGQLVGNYATEWTTSEDGLNYVFTMRDGLKWSDGSELNAKDFEYSWKRAAATETASDYNYMLNVIKGYPDSLEVKASDDGKTLTVALASPCAYFLDLAAFPTYFAVKQDVVESAKGYKDDAGKVINPGAWALEAGFVCSGPYMLTEWKHNESMVYEKNPNYWDAANVKMEKLEFMLSDDTVAAFAAYKDGSLDFIDAVPTDEIKTVKDSPEYHVVDELGTYYVMFNVKSALFDGKTVEQANAMRRAFFYLIDRQYIVDTVAQSGQKLASSFIPYAMADGHGGEFKVNDADWTYPAVDGYYDASKVDLDAARALLTEAGFKFDDKGMLSAETPLSITYIHNTSAAHAAVAECLQQDFGAIGIQVQIKTNDWKVFLNERKAGNYDVARGGWIADFNDAINMLEMFATDSGNNDPQFGR